MEDIAKQTWEKLKRMFVGKSLANECFMKKKLLNLRMEEGVNHMEHLNIFNKCIVGLQKMDVVYPDSTSAPHFPNPNSLYPSFFLPVFLSLSFPPRNLSLPTATHRQLRYESVVVFVR
ncbi:hypothetical protein GBA52_019970 [Prunus armeniaca]|nr:hypothetical protein GBA52_019970 [Prunus armeniaca]